MQTEKKLTLLDFHYSNEAKTQTISSKSIQSGRSDPRCYYTTTELIYYTFHIVLLVVVISQDIPTRCTYMMQSWVTGYRLFALCVLYIRRESRLFRLPMHARRIVCTELPLNGFPFRLRDRVSCTMTRRNCLILSSRLAERN